MRALLKKVSLFAVVVAAVGLLLGTVHAEAAVKWAFSTSNGQKKASVNATITMEKGEYQDMNLYRNGKQIKEKDATYSVKWYSSDKNVVYVDKASGKMKADKYGKMTKDTGKAKITAVVKNKKTGSTTKKSFTVKVKAVKEMESSEKETPANAFRYSIENGEVTILGLADRTLTEIRIPKKINGYPVTRISNWAFSGCSGLKYADIPEGIMYSWEKAFDGTLYGVLKIIEEDTSRWGLWDLTYKEFIEMYQSIGTEKDLFIEMLKEKGPYHGRDLEFNAVKNLEFVFPDLVTEKIYALHYAPFEYDMGDFNTGEYGKTEIEFFLDHGGVCGVLTHRYKRFIRDILGEKEWKYCSFGSAEVNHEVLLVQTEDGKVFQIDNCTVGNWWTGLEFRPVLGEESDINYQQLEEFQNWKMELEASMMDEEDKYEWSMFSVPSLSSSAERRLRPIWYNFDTKEFESYFCDGLPKCYTVVYRGLPGRVVSMAGSIKFEGYSELTELNFEK